MTVDRSTVPLVLGLGASLGDREATLRRTIESLGEELSELFGRSVAAPAIGPLVESAPVARDQALAVADDPPFLNTVVSTPIPEPDDDDLRALLRLAKRLERRAGRHRGRRDGPRALDVDLLLVGDRIRRLPAEDGSGAVDDAEVDAGDGALELPHSRLHRRLFVLEPLAELAPDLMVPGRGRVADVLAAVREELRAEGQTLRRVAWTKRPLV